MKRVFLASLVFALLGAGAVAVCQKYGLGKGIPWIYVAKGHRYRTLEITANIIYDAKPVRLVMRTECWSPGDPLTGVSMEAAPQQIAGVLPDGSAVAFRGMTHLCDYAEKTITAEQGGASGPRALRNETPIPALPAVWFSSRRDPELIEVGISPATSTSRYQPGSFSMREVPPSAIGDPAAAFKRTLPAWSRYLSKSKGYCSGTVERLSFDLLSDVARHEVQAGTFRAQAWSPAILKPGTPPLLGPVEDFSVPGEIEWTPERRQQRNEENARQQKTFPLTPEGDVWIAQSLQVRRYFSSPRPRPTSIRLGEASLPVGTFLVAPIPGSPDVALISAACPNWR